MSVIHDLVAHNYSRLRANAITGADSGKKVFFEQASGLILLDPAATIEAYRSVPTGMYDHLLISVNNALLLQDEHRLKGVLDLNNDGYFVVRLLLRRK